MCARTLSLFEHVVATDSSRQVGVHTRQVKGRLFAGGGGGRQGAREIMWSTSKGYLWSHGTKFPRVVEPWRHRPWLLAALSAGE
jgi:hypothetical protein